MAAEIIEFPNRDRGGPLVSSVARLEQIVRELERHSAGQPADGLDYLLAVMERMGVQLADLASHLLDDDARRPVERAFTSLSDKIAETRDALGACGGPKHP
jgi:hypothetical protein